MAENWGLCPFGEGELGPHLTQCCLGRGLYILPSGIFINPDGWPHQTWAKNWGVVRFGEGSWVPI